ncbi:PepSY domain-containing protein [Novosphingobium sp.]|uniref:PepSY domain-containing protein n=1 Tax=Novosphingobium sp. TaxID=1874826 RepID=UPI0025CE2576|nr:PepSY domain-containing protein [Novosphingobium sp.]
MARSTAMQRLARWHIWLGWVAAVPLLLWTISGLVMVARPIETVRGNDLRIAQTRPAFDPSRIILPAGFTRPVRSLTYTLEPSGLTGRAELIDGQIARFDAAGIALRDFDELAARQLVARQIVGGDKSVSARLFAADRVPLDFRKPIAVWQVVLADGTHVYVGKQSGQIEAVRTRFWRFYDFMWGLHIMDPVEREDTHHPVLIMAAISALASCVLGTVLLLRRRRRASA